MSTEYVDHYSTICTHVSSGMPLSRRCFQRTLHWNRIHSALFTAVMSGTVSQHSVHHYTSSSRTLLAIRPEQRKLTHSGTHFNDLYLTDKLYVLGNLLLCVSTLFIPTIHQGKNQVPPYYVFNVSWTGKLPHANSYLIYHENFISN